MDINKIRKLIVMVLVMTGFCQLYAQAYKDERLSTEERVDDLLERMTLDEKIAQLRHIHAQSIMENGKLSEGKLHQLLNGKSVGFVEGFTLSGEQCLELMNGVQRYMRE